MNKRAIINALEAQYEAEIAKADATCHIYFNNSVGIGDIIGGLTGNGDGGGLGNLLGSLGSSLLNKK